MDDKRQIINTYDIDGVISIGLTPRPEDVIITGRSYEEAQKTYEELHQLGIYNAVYFQPMNWDYTTRESSGVWKGQVLKQMIENGIMIGKHFEDDEIQKAEIEKIIDIPVVLISHNLTPKDKQTKLV